MQWYERFGLAASALGDAASSFWDLIQDSDDKTAGEVLGTALLVPIHLGNAAFQTVAGPVQGVIEPIGAAAEWANDTITYLPRTYQTAINLSRSPTWQAQQGLTPGHESEYSAFIDPDTWAKAWEKARTTSLGQSITFAMGYGPGTPGNFRTDILDLKAVEEIKDDPLFNVVSGFQDGLVAWYADPIAGVGKGVKAFNRVQNVFQAGSRVSDPWLERQLFKLPKVGQKEIDPDRLANSDATKEFLAWASGRSARQIRRHPLIERMSRPDDAAGILSGLLDRQDAETAAKVLAVGWGSENAFRELLRTNVSLANRIQDLREGSNRLLDMELALRDANSEFVGFRGSRVRDQIGSLNPAKDDYHERLRKLLIVHDDDTKKLLEAAVGDVSGASGMWGAAVDQVPRARLNRKANRNLAYDTGDWATYYQSTAFAPPQKLILPKFLGTPIKVITGFPFKVAQGFTNKRPPSWIDPNRPDSSAGFSAYLRHAGVFDETKANHYLSRYLEAVDIQGRRRVVETAERDAIAELGRRAGLSADYSDLLALKSMTARNSALAAAKSGKRDGIYGMDGDGNEIRWPILETQEINSFPLLDLQAYKRIFEHHGTALKAFELSGPRLAQAADDAWDVFSGLWSATTLLRPGYLIRNLSDSALRIMASMGAMTLLGHVAQGARAGILANAATRTSNAVMRAKTAAGAAGDIAGWMIGGRTRAELEQSLRSRVDQLGRDLGSVRTQSALGVVYKGVQYESPYFGKAESYQQLVGSSMESIARTRDEMLSSLRNHYAQWDVVQPDDPDHLEAWVRAIHHQIGKSAIGRRFLHGGSADDVLRWLTRGDGSALLRRIGGRDTDPREVVGHAQAVIDLIVPLVPGPDPLLLRRAALDGTVDRELLEQLFPDVSKRPQVHGPTIDVNLQEGPLPRVLDGITASAFKWIAQLPEDKLIRHPTFRSLMVGNIKRLHDNLESQLGHPHLTAEQVSRIQHAAREQALQQLKGLLYDGTTKSNIAHRFRMLSAFFSAWEDSLTKWTRLIKMDPSILVNGGKLWMAPNEMGLGATVDPNTGQRVPRLQVLKYDEKGALKPAPSTWNIFDMNDESFIEARLPEWLAKHLPGNPGDAVRVSKASLNLVLQGNEWWLPGAGPVTQFSASKLAMEHPTLMTDVYKWAIPYGPETDVAMALLPAWAKRLWQADANVADSGYASAMVMIAQNMEMESRLHGRTRPSDADFYREAQARTDAFFKLRSWVNFFSPVGMQFVSPYQFYIDQYRELRQRDPETADDEFLSRYGNDFYLFTTSLSKNNLGLPASREVWDKSQKMRDLIADDPELAAIRLGRVADASFDQYVYASQFQQRVQEGSSKTVRERRDPMEALKENQRNLGWQQYTQYMDAVDGIQFDPGQDPEFIDFLRSFIGKTLAAGNPEFAKDYFATDMERIPNRIAKFQKLVTDKRELQKPEIRQLAKYLYARDQFLAVLQQRKGAGGASTLTAKANQDLAAQWKLTQLKLAEEDTQFGRIFWRYLSNERLQLSALSTLETNNGLVG
ncbi:hypothetical protein ABZ470_23710 [Streptosporangium sp. NPDC020072]|uniref:hypothetical protein n=1 Tax=Streptosporangium sp. NPDC020072 TaxID=3154788 RepID=UPI00344A5449